LGRDYLKSDEEKTNALAAIIRRIPPYLGVIERVAHRHEDTVSAIDVAAHWHQHFRGEVGGTDPILKAQAVAFLQLAAGSGLGNVIIGRRGQPTRMSFNAEAVSAFVQRAQREQVESAVSSECAGVPVEEAPAPTPQAKTSATGLQTLGQGIFVAHGKNKQALEQLKRILEQFRIPYKVAVEEPNLGRPISGKVRDIMKSCNCAILIFTADEEFKDKAGNVIWRPSENVVYELGATAFLYDNRIVIMKEESVTFPTNSRDIGYISFAKDQLEAKSLDILKELIGFGIVRVST
jgi:predicted nucleotide-binding protein